MLKRKSSLLITLAILLGILPGAACVYHGIEIRDLIPMDNPAYEKHKRSIVIFTHKKHAEDYTKANPDLFKDGCGMCHHDESYEPLVDLKYEDDVKSCIECHSIPGNALRNEDNEYYQPREERLKYHMYVIHHSCKPCHQAYNEATGAKNAPTSCAKCHLEES